MDMQNEVKCYVLEDSDHIHKLVIMLAHACGGIAVQGKVKMQNIAFMLSHIGDKTGEMGFYPDMHGPYSDIVDGEIRYLNDLGILTDGNRTRLTNTGRSVADRLADEDPRLFKIIGRYKEMFNDMSTNEILTYVYRSYPLMVAHSAARDKLEQDAEKHIMSMLRKEKISSGKAAELLGRDRIDVIKTAVNKGIQVFEFDVV